jgi:micrococcal nuclease
VSGATARILGRALTHAAGTLCVVVLGVAGAGCDSQPREDASRYGDPPPGTSAPDRAEPPLPAPDPDGAIVLEGTVARVVDGDTIRVRVRGFETVVRLVGIDTPETVHPSRPVECWGPEASAHARRLMATGSRVRLETDPTQDARDRFGRLLAHVYSGSARGPDSVNRRLVREGAAKVYVFRGREFRHLDAFRSAERTARAERRGLWGEPCRGRTAAR